MLPARRLLSRPALVRVATGLATVTALGGVAAGVTVVHRPGSTLATTPTGVAAPASAVALEAALKPEALTERDHPRLSALASEVAVLKAERRRKAAAEKAERQRREAAAARAARNAVRDPRGVARAMLAERGWAGQFSCLESLWTKESNWNHRAQNPSSGAYGIPQSLPGSKMASAGSDWRTNPVTQIRWGLGYIADRYGTPCGAWSHSQSVGWY